MIIAIPSLPVVICMDRAGLVGGDGDTHQGIFDIPLFKSIPGLSFLAPVSERETALLLEWAVNKNKPVMIRYAKDYCVPDELIPDTPVEAGKGVTIRKQEDATILFLSLGGLLEEVCGAADLLADRGLIADIHYLRFIRPLDYRALKNIIMAYDMVIMVEEGIQSGGLGEELSAMLAESPGETLFSFLRCSLRVSASGHPERAYFPMRTGQQLPGGKS